MPCPPGRGRLASVVALALLVGCGGSPESDGGATPASATAGTPSVTTPVPVPTTTPPPTIAPSGDEDLDSLDAELAVFEEEDRGLDEAVAAAEGEGR